MADVQAQLDALQLQILDQVNVHRATRFAIGVLAEHVSRLQAPEQETVFEHLENMVAKLDGRMPQHEVPHFVTMLHAVRQGVLAARGS